MTGKIFFNSVWPQNERMNEWMNEWIQHLKCVQHLESLTTYKLIAFIVYIKGLWDPKRYSMLSSLYSVFIRLWTSNNNAEHEGQYWFRCAKRCTDEICNNMITPYDDARQHLNMKLARGEVQHMCDVGDSNFLSSPLWLRFSIKMYAW